MGAKARERSDLAGEGGGGGGRVWEGGRENFLKIRV